MGKKRGRNSHSNSRQKQRNGNRGKQQNSETTQQETIESISKNATECDSSVKNGSVEELLQHSKSEDSLTDEIKPKDTDYNLKSSEVNQTHCESLRSQENLLNVAVISNGTGELNNSVKTNDVEPIENKNKENASATTLEVKFCDRTESDPESPAEAQEAVAKVNEPPHAVNCSPPATENETLSSEIADDSNIPEVSSSIIESSPDQSGEVGSELPPNDNNSFVNGSLPPSPNVDSSVVLNHTSDISDEVVALKSNESDRTNSNGDTTKEVPVSKIESPATELHVNSTIQELDKADNNTTAADCCSDSIPDSKGLCTLKDDEQVCIVFFS